MYSQRSSSKERFELMEKIHQDYYPLFLEICREKKYTSDIDKMIEDFVIGRIGAQKGVRAFIFKQLYLLAGGKENINYLLTATELHLASMYCFNVAADKKIDYNTLKKIEIGFASRKIVYELALRAVTEFTKQKFLIEAIKKLFHKTDLQFYKGQAFDNILNLYKNRDKYPKDIAANINILSQEKVWSNYGMEKDFILGVIDELPRDLIKDFTFERTYGINAAMFENFGDIIGLILNLDESVVSRLRNYGKFYGLGMQIINDVQDYSLDLLDDDKIFVTREKNKSDVFNDIKNGKITWPIKYALEINKSLDDLFRINLGKEDISYDECDKIRLLLSENGAIKKSVLEAVFYGNLANTSIENFGDEKTRQVLIETATTMMKLSKYISILEKKYKIVLRPTKVEISERMKLGNAYY